MWRTLDSRDYFGRSFTLFIWEMPALFEANPAIRSVFVEAHEFGAKALLTLIGLHAGAALFRRLVLRDGVLQRMLPGTSASAPARKPRLKSIAQGVKNKSLLSLIAYFKVTGSRTRARPRKSLSLKTLMCNGHVLLSSRVESK
jgi:hypothetical protein